MTRDKNETRRCDDVVFLRAYHIQDPSGCSFSPSIVRHLVQPKGATGHFTHPTRLCASSGIGPRRRPFLLAFAASAASAPLFAPPAAAGTGAGAGAAPIGAEARPPEPRRSRPPPRRPRPRAAGRGASSGRLSRRPRPPRPGRFGTALAGGAAGRPGGAPISIADAGAPVIAASGPDLTSEEERH